MWSTSTGERLVLFAQPNDKKPEKKAVQKPKLDAAAARGLKLFQDRQGDDYPSCLDCHNVVPEKREAKEAKFIGPGASLYDSARRAGWRGFRFRIQLLLHHPAITTVKLADSFLLVVKCTVWQLHGQIIL